MSAVMPENLRDRMESEPALLFGAAGFPERATAKKRLQRDVGLAVKLMLNRMDALARQLIACRTKEEFCSLRNEVLPKYFNALLGIAGMMRSVMTDADYSGASQEAIAYIMKFFRSEGAAYLGPDGKAEVLFCLSTLKKALGMVRFITSRQVPPELREKDSAFAREFAAEIAFFQLNLECLRVAIAGEDNLNPDVGGAILDGLRASVMAYATARQAMDLRGFSEERYAEIPDVSWDEEDEALANF